MKIGFIGLGKLGLPVATCIGMAGHDVIGYDLDPTRMSKEPQPYVEAGPSGEGDFNDFLATSNIRFGTIGAILQDAEVVFVAVQTPHDSRYEGVTPMPPERVDFDYSYLKHAVRSVMDTVRENWTTLGQKEIVVAIISTVLPGTMIRDIEPMLTDNIRLVYNPSFIAMGQTMQDFLNPEFVLLGRRAGSESAVNKMKTLYATLVDAPVRVMGMESAELTKVGYNTFISMKIAFANTMMEICDGMSGADVDEVTGALKAATKRVVGPAYMDGGMGDGGGCHPRDNIAMSWFARDRGLSHDLFENVMECRERQAKWLADKVLWMANKRKLPMAILGYAYKPGIDLTVGSPALLVADYITSTGAEVRLLDPYVNGKEFQGDGIEVTTLDSERKEYTGREPSVFLIGCKHPHIEEYDFAEGSVVIDPFRLGINQPGVEVINVGQRGIQGGR